MNPQDTTLKIGDRVEVTAAQSYDVTWDEDGDRIVGDYGTLQDISALAQKDNEATGTHDAAPYKVRLDNGETVWAADVRPETEGLRRTIAYLDKGNDDKLKRISDLETRNAELEAQREALAARLRAGQRWRQGRNPALVSQDYVSQDELRAMFGIPLTAPWDTTEPTATTDSTPA